MEDRDSATAASDTTDGAPADTTSDANTAVLDDVLDDVLIEEISIDGMCGVY